VHYSAEIDAITVLCVGGSLFYGDRRRAELTMVLAIVTGDYRSAFLWMIAAAVVDATDEAIARAARQRCPGSTARLGDIVDT
jgi:hypothetical protein